LKWIADLLEDREKEVQELQDGLNYPDVQVGDKVKIRRRVNGSGKPSRYMQKNAPEKTGRVVFVSEHWVTVDLGGYRECIWKQELSLVEGDGGILWTRS
jgi:hypothetical protein